MAGSGATFVVTSAMAGAAIGATTAAITGGDIGKGAMIGGVMGGATAGVGGGFSGGGQGVFGSGGFSGTTLGTFGGTVEGYGTIGSNLTGMAPTAIESTASQGFFGTGGSFFSGAGNFFSDVGFGDVLLGAGGLLSTAGDVGEARGQAQQFAFKEREALTQAEQTAGVTVRQAEELKRAGSRTEAARRARIAESGIRGSTGQPLKVSTQLEDEIAFQNAVLLEGGQFRTDALLAQAGQFGQQRTSLLRSIPTRAVGGTLTAAGKVFS